MEKILKSEVQIIQFWLHFEAKNSGSLPNFQGSTFRGVFGHSLKRVSCTMHNRNCGICDLKPTCPYFQTFECESDEWKKSGFQFQPNSYVLHTLPIQTYLAAGDKFRLGFSLFGKKNEIYLPYILLV